MESMYNMVKLKIIKKLWHYFRYYGSKYLAFGVYSFNYDIKKIEDKYNNN